MNILVNGSPTTLPEPLSLDQMLNRLEDIPQNFAIAVNGLFVPRSVYVDTAINEGDQIELLIPMQGG